MEQRRPRPPSPLRREFAFLPPSDKSTILAELLSSPLQREFTFFDGRIEKKNIMDQYNFLFSDSWSVGNDVANDVPCGERSSYVGRDYTAEFTTNQLKILRDMSTLQDLCCCKIKRTHGLPCFHDIALYRSVDRPIPLSSIHPHWSTLSMHAQRHTDEGARSDRAAELIERLNEMDSDSRESMMDRFLDMADPSRCTVRPPAYNTEHRGRPTVRDEQSRGRIPSFIVSTSESRASRIPTLRRTNGRDHLVEKFPQQYQRYIFHCVDVRPDGHCGFRAIAAQLYGSEDEWAQVRHDLIQEIEQNWVLYNQIYPKHNYVSQVLQRLRCFLPSAPEDY
ncbi:hypothetical protein RHMOL_Rhmol05G0098400 [Rhododendron molle]|uniref:Uncharacterized protein n=1 Tax=Rhododendron molle TaxID=49168 RepID=A0ACC0NN79_RHOML|nr:hypothetical protein RHMOL_Rhmol05G0098400 [Rhododendron molle]